MATILELINDFYNEKDKSTMQNSDEFSMDKTSNKKTPLLHGNEKSATPKIEHSNTGMYFCLIPSPGAKGRPRAEGPKARVLISTGV